MYKQLTPVEKGRTLLNISNSNFQFRQLFSIEQLSVNSAITSFCK